MFKKLFSTDLAMTADGASGNDGRGFGALRTAYVHWRLGNDIAAIAIALNRLPNRRLELIGLHRDGLVDAVGDMIVSAEENRAIGREVIAILDASADSTFSCHDFTPPIDIQSRQKHQLSNDSLS
jgi:hypothetical protein